MSWRTASSTMECALFYHYQSGAINESFADIFGELHRPQLQRRHGHRSVGLADRRGLAHRGLPDMRRPGRHGHPTASAARAGRPAASDDGGVHRNSGVGNKAAYLIAEGGRFNGEDRRASGGRAWRASTTRRDHDVADTGRQLPRPRRCARGRVHGPGGQVRLRAGPLRCGAEGDCAHGDAPDPREVSASPRAGLRCRHAARWTCSSTTSRPPAPAPGPTSAWQATRAAGTTPRTPTTTRPGTGPGRRAATPTSTRRPRGPPRHGHAAALCPTAARTAYLRFEHGYASTRSTRRYDGGVVEVKVGDGSWPESQELLHPRRLRRPHDQPDRQPVDGSAGLQRQFAGLWSSARVDLSAFAGQRVKAALPLGSDRSLRRSGLVHRRRPHLLLRLDEDLP